MKKKKRINRYRNLPKMFGGDYLGYATQGLFGNTSNTQSNTMGTVNTLSIAAGSALNSMVPESENPYAYMLPGQSSLQQSVDSIVGSILPYYGIGKAVGDWAKTDYQKQDELTGAYEDPEKFEVASTIGMFIDPASAFISGISGEGWTPKQQLEKNTEESEKVREKKMDQANQASYLLAMQEDPWNQREYMGNAAYGGEISSRTLPEVNVVGNYPLSTVPSIPYSPQAPQRTIARVPNNRTMPQTQMSQEDVDSWIKFKQGMIQGNFPGSTSSAGPAFRTTAGASLGSVGKQSFGACGPGGCKAYGGEVSEAMPSGGMPMVTEYTEGGTHEQNANGGIPIDALGNKAETSKFRPVALGEEGEMSWYNPKTGKTFVFSNRILARDL